ncbi:MAG TPA: glycosyltransferase [Acetobacteraceae bacterium]|nr:glycosyltransferase [Acetobacteraceae bacterium]
MDAYSEHLIALAVQAFDAGRFAAAAQLLRLALGHSGRDAFVLYGLGHMAYQQNDFAAAAGWLDQALAMDPGNPKAHIDRGLAMDAALAMAVMTEGIDQLRAGDFRRGWWKFEARLIASPGLVPRRAFAEQRWFGDAAELAGRTLLLHSEQGHGDAIQFVRYVKMVAALGATVLLEGHPGLLPLYRELPDVSGVFALNDKLPRFDMQCPLLSLPLAFRTDLTTIPGHVPYLAAPPDRVALWRIRLGVRSGRGTTERGVARRIGIAWSGNAAYPGDQERSMPLAALENLLAGTEHAFHVVQTEIRPADRLVLLRQPHVRDHSERLADFADTAALLSQLDLLIAVDTSVAHLAGALGIPVWLMLPARADWRWLTQRDDSPWYPTMRLFRQTQPGDWRGVVEQVIAAL